MKYIFTFLLFMIVCGSIAQKVELRIPIAHTGYVQAVAISPDEKYIATGASDKSVKIWSVANGMQLKTLQLNLDVESQVIFLADKRHLAIRIEGGWEYWDMLEGKMEYEFLRPKMFNDYKIGVILSTDGTMAAVVNAETITIRKTVDGTLLKTISWKAPDPLGSFAINNIKFNKKNIAIAEGGKLVVYSLENSALVQFEQPDPNPDQIGLAPDNNELYVNGKTKLYKVNLDTREVTVLQEKTVTVDAVSFSNNGKYLLMSPRRVVDRTTNRELHYFFETEYNSIAAGSEKYFVFFDRPTSNGYLYLMGSFEKLKDLKNETAGLQRMMVKAKTNQLIFTTNTNEARFWNTTTYKFEKTVPFATNDGADRYNSEFANQGDFYLSGTFSRQKVIDINTGNVVLATSDKGVKSMSPDGTIGFTEKGGAGSIINLTSGAIIKTIGLSYPRYFPSPDNQTVVYQQYPEARVSIYNYRTNNEINAELQVGEYPIFNSAGNKLYSIDVLYNQSEQLPNLITTSVTTGRQLAKIPLLVLNGMRVHKFAISPDEKYAAVLYREIGEFRMSKNNVLITYEFATGKQVSRTGGIYGGDEISFLGNSYLIAMMSEITNMVQIYDGVTATHLVDLAHFKGANDWIAVTPDGLYDGNMESLKKFYFVRGNEFVNPGAYFEKFYTPNLFARLVAGERFAPVDVDIRPAPKVKISYAQLVRNLNVVDDKVPTYQNTTGLAEITVTASAENDKIDEIRLFHNGKIVNLATRNLFVTDNNSGTDSKKYTISLLPGGNSFRAVALNSQRTESEPDEIVVNYNAAGAQANVPAPVNSAITGIIDPVDRNATLYLVVVGINKYKNQQMNLNYALADATAFKDEAERDAHTMLTNVKTYFITDDAADKNGITSAFTEVQKAARPQDLFVFYYAGHGVISDKNKEFYLVPNDVTDLKNVDEALERNGIPSKMLQKFAIDIAAQKQVFILDACQSAGAFAKLMANDANQQKNLAVVARSTGTHWIAASGSQQFANEFSQLGHGVFTYILLKAMKGEAASNKMVTINGLKNFLQVQVPDLMRKYNGTPQYPASYGFGNDFPVEMIR